MSFLAMRHRPDAPVASSRARSLARPRVGGRLLTSAVGLLFALSSSCQPKNTGDPSLDRPSRPPRFGPTSKVQQVSPEIPAAGPVTLMYGTGRVTMRHAVAVAENDWLHVVATASETQSCDDSPYPDKQAWIEVRLDPGPMGDFYADLPIPATVDFSIPGDNASWREAHPSNARVQLSSLTAETVTFKLEMKRVLTNPDPKVATVVTAGGAIEVTVCPSALALLGRSHPGIADKAQATASFGGETFPLRSGLVFLYDDGKNPTVASAMTLYEAEEVSCAAAARALSDAGGGIPGRQVHIYPMPLGAARKGLAVPSPVQLDGLVVTTGETYFEQQMLNKTPMRGWVQLTDADLSEDPLGGFAPPMTPPPATTGVAGTIHVETPEGRVSGRFKAGICKRAF
jgi:hypothetical protein